MLTFFHWANISIRSHRTVSSESDWDQRCWKFKLFRGIWNKVWRINWGRKDQNQRRNQLVRWNNWQHQKTWSNMKLRRTPVLTRLKLTDENLCYSDYNVTRRTTYVGSGIQWKRVVTIVRCAADSEPTRNSPARSMFSRTSALRLCTKSKTCSIENLLL